MVVVVYIGEGGTVCKVFPRTVSSCWLLLSSALFEGTIFKLGNRCFHSTLHVLIPERCPPSW